MPKGLGNFIFKLLTSSPSIHRYLNKKVVSSFTDSGPLSGLYSTKGSEKTSLWEILDKEFFALEVPEPKPGEIASLPNLEEVLALFERKGPVTKSRVSVLLPFFAQHLTDAVFQSDGQFGTDAPHEIILNQIYGNTPGDEALLRSGQDGKLKTQTRIVNGREAEYPDALCEKKGDHWAIKKEYEGLSYFKGTDKATTLLDKYKDKEGELCATGLFQGNMTLGNFAITSLLVREHNRLCDGIRSELGSAGDDEIFRIAQQNNVTAYMKVVIEDYINAFAGQKMFILDTKSFFHEEKRWCRETAIPYHFNILYRLHSMMPDGLIGLEEMGFAAMGANNGLVMAKGLGEIFEIASRQSASRVSLGNTHEKLLAADRAGVVKGRQKLGSFNSHKEVQQEGSSVGFEAFDPNFRSALSRLYGGDPNRVEYTVGTLAELPKPGVLEKLGIKDEPIIGPTLMNAIGKHAFRHILSNRFMSREYLNPKVMTEFGWKSLHETASVSDLVKRNVSGEMDQAQAEKLKVGFSHPV
ncbi:peroxidase family protein [Pseudophaeobacter sp.]|uniref:peroxidase family protein n=1 Tax=Pseudophaeobacter sp. TaxID=1971739 RepID=UPI003296D255